MVEEAVENDAPVVNKLLLVTFVVFNNVNVVDWIVADEDMSVLVGSDSLKTSLDVVCMVTISV